MNAASAWRALLLVALVGGLAMALRPLAAGQGAENSFFGADKLLHAGYFALLWCLADRARFATAGIRAAALLMFGVAIELAQHWFTSTRGMSAADLLADAAGLALGAVLMRLVSTREPEKDRR